MCQGAQALFEELCEEVDKAEKFFPIPEGALASLAAAKQAAGEGKQMDTRQLDQALRAVGAAQTSLAPLHKASLIAAEAQCHHADSILAQVCTPHLYTPLHPKPLCQSSICHFPLPSLWVVILNHVAAIA